MALTRARHQVHLIVDRTRPSSFAIELLHGDYDVSHIGRRADDGNDCPECRSGHIEQRQQAFASCTNFPYCEFIAPICSDCGNGVMFAPKGAPDGMYRCTTDGCSGTANLCPKCRIGALVRKKSKYGDIVACHIWPRCDYIEKAAQQDIRGGRRASRPGRE